MNEPSPNTRPLQKDDLAVRPKILFWIAVVAAIFTLLSATESSFGQVAGGPTGLGLVSAGFILAYALQRRP